MMTASSSRTLATRALGISLVIVAAAPGAMAQREHRFAFDAGVGQIGWLSPDNWGTTVSAQGRVLRSRRLAFIVGVRGTFNLATPGTGLTRRDDVLSGTAGVEASAVEHPLGALFVSVSGAYSRYRARYGGPNAGLVSDGRPVSGYTWPSGIVGVRAEFLRARRVGLSVRGDVRPRGGRTRSLNPTLGVGLIF
jgi:hypothetical protein